MKQHHVIFIPGLNDQHPLNKNLIKLIPIIYKLYGIKVHTLAPHWEEGNSFKPKLKIITDKIDEVIRLGYIVSLIGQSAGGSAALNAFCEKRNVVNGVVNVTGRLKEGKNVRPSLEWAARNSPAFKESVLLFEKENEPTLSAKDRKRIMTLKPFWDETVPASTVAVNGATNKTAPIIEHSLSGILTTTIYSKPIIHFLKNR